MWITGLLLLIHIVFFSISEISDADAWGHALLGRILVEKGRIPCFSDYSWVPGDTTPRAFVCGTPLLFYLILHYLGYPGLLLLRFVLLTSICYFLWRALQLHATPWPLSIFAILCFFCIGHYRFLPRGDFFNLLFFIVYLYTLEKFLLQSGKGIWYLPLLQVLWSNIHQLSPLGVAVTGLYFVHCYALKHWQAGHRLGVVAILCTLASFATPAGYSQVVQTLHLIVSNPEAQEMTRGIGEFLPLVQIHDPSLLFGFFFCLFVVTILVIANRQWRESYHLILFLLFAWAAWQHVRMAGFFALHGAYLLAKQMWLWWQQRNANTHPKFLALGYSGVMLLQLALFYLWLPIFFKGDNGGNGFSCSPDRNAVPVGGVQFLQQYRFTGNIYTDYNSGCYVGYYLYPSAKIFMHSLGLYYSLDAYRLYRAIASGKVNPTNLILTYNIELFVFEHKFRTNAKLVKWLYQTPDWLLVYLDQTTVIFAAKQSDFVRQNELVGTVLDAVRQRPDIGASPRKLVAITALLLDFGADQEAEAAAQQALQLDPGEAVAWNHLGVVADRQGKAELALQRFIKSLTLNPNEESPRQNIVGLFSGKIVLNPADPWHQKAMALCHMENKRH
jgi:tetratricopeptide (TPR) repeat protein